PWSRSSCRCRSCSACPRSSTPISRITRPRRSRCRASRSRTTSTSTSTSATVGCDRGGGGRRGGPGGDSKGAGGGAVGGRGEPIQDHLDEYEHFGNRRLR